MLHVDLFKSNVASCGCLPTSFRQLTHGLSAGALATQLQQEISYLADAYGGPTFPPHVTLVGGVEGTESQILESAMELADALKVLQRSELYYLDCCILVTL